MASSTPTGSFLRQSRWNLCAVGTASGVLSWIVFAVVDKPLGVTTSLTGLAGACAAPFIGADTVAANAYFKSHVFKFDYGMLFLGGIALGGFLSAILSAIHTSLRYSERAEKHRSAATSYASLQKELTQRLAGAPTDEVAIDTWITAFRLSWDTTAKEAPTVPRKVWERTLQEEVDAAKARAKKASAA